MSTESAPLLPGAHNGTSNRNALSYFTPRRIVASVLLVVFVISTVVLVVHEENKWNRVKADLGPHEKALALLDHHPLIVSA